MMKREDLPEAGGWWLVAGSWWLKRKVQSAAWKVGGNCSRKERVVHEQEQG